MTLEWTSAELDQNRLMNRARSGRTVPKGVKAAKCDECGARRSILALYRTDLALRACRLCVDGTPVVVETPAPVKVARAPRVKVAPVVAEPVETPAEPVAEASRCWTYLHTQGGTRRCMVRPDLHDGAHEYEPVIVPIGPIAAVEPEPVPADPLDILTDAEYAAVRAVRRAAEAPEPIAPAAPVLSAVPSRERPTCPRCDQSFRVKGSGLAWHVANRTDCAPARLSVAV